VLLSRSVSTRRGFTLVELLVVVSIIAVLMGLLLPAVLRSRARARITQCVNNQRELGSAILQYEAAKGYLPGYANNLRGVKVSWIPVILPYLGRQDLWEGEGGTGWRDNPNGAPAPHIGQLVCPEERKAGPDLSYVVNVGQTFPAEDEPQTQIGLFRNRCLNVRQVTLNSIKSTTQRPMLSELPLDMIAGGRGWNYRSELADNTIVTAQRFGFILPNSTEMIKSYLPPLHTGVVIITFCDGHVDAVADDAECSIFDNANIE